MSNTKMELYMVDDAMALLSGEEDPNAHLLRKERPAAEAIRAAIEQSLREMSKLTVAQMSRQMLDHASVVEMDAWSKFKFRDLVKNPDDYRSEPAGSGAAIAKLDEIRRASIPHPHEAIRRTEEQYSPQEYEYEMAKCLLAGLRIDSTANKALSYLQSCFGRSRGTFRLRQEQGICGHTRLTAGWRMGEREYGNSYEAGPGGLCSSDAAEFLREALRLMMDVEDADLKRRCETDSQIARERAAFDARADATWTARLFREELARLCADPSKSR